MAFASRTHYAPGDLVTSADYNQGMDNEDWLKGNCGQLIASTVLAADAASVAFATIAATFKHLVIPYYARGDRAATTDGVGLQFNADTGNNYDSLRVGNRNGAGDVQAFATGAMQVGVMTGANATANKFTHGRIEINHYANAVNHKIVAAYSSFHITTANTDWWWYWASGEWKNAAAITAILLLPITGANFKAGSRFELYGTN